jgi:hypothetical protein
MFTLHFPIKLPEENSFFDNGQYPVPPLPGGLSVGCVSNEKAPLVLRISGFAVEQDAFDFCPTLRIALRLAALGSDHSLSPSDAQPVKSNQKHFDGSVPTVTLTGTTALPYHASASVHTGLHISVLSNLIGTSISQGSPGKIVANPRLALALELHADCQFAGERNAQFIVLMTALEVLVPQSTKKGKRGAVIGLVKMAIAKLSHPDPKSVGKTLDALYVTRNDFIHEAKPVTDGDLQSLKQIVRDTLRELII